MRAIGNPRLASAIALATLLLGAPAFAQNEATGQGAATCADVAASRWEPGHPAATQEFESFDATRVIATCEPAFKASPNDNEIKAWLGRAYLRDGRVDEGVKLLTEAAQAGNAVAQLVMSDAYRDGTGVIADKQQALTMLTASAGQDFPPAQLALADAYRWGNDIVEKDSTRALALYGRIAERGMAKPQSRLGEMYRLGEGTAVDFDKAYRYYSLAANQKDPDGLYGLGLLSDAGQGTTTDHAKAIDYFEQAADLGNVYARSDLGYLYLMGLGVPSDSARAAELFQAAATQGNAYAQYSLGYLYETGTGVEKDVTHAVELYEAADAGGEFAATNALSSLYLEGIGVEKDPAKALAYALRAAEGGYADSQNRVGYIYAEGIGVLRDSAKALDWFKKAAAQEHELAIKNVAELEAEAACSAAAASQYEPQFESVGRELSAIDTGVAIPACEDAVAKDPGSDEDKAWLARAYLAAERYDDALPLLETAAAGNSALAQSLLGSVLMGDFGQAPDYTAAVAVLLPAADAGFAPAQFSLGYAYDVGNGVEVDNAQAADWYRRAGEQGIARAQASLGYLYHGGNGVPLDYAQAMEWYTKAAEQNDVVGIYGIGQLYEYGQGVPQDYAKAFEYLQRGADLGDSYAQSDLGYLYDMGYGVTADPAQAAHWYGLAADQGYALAEANLGQLYTSGRGVPQDYAKAFDLYTRAHDQGEVWGTVGLVEAYLYGEGVDVDYEQARAYAQEALDKGATYGMTALGYLYSEGLGVPRDFDRAIELFDQAAAQGDQYGIDNAAEARAERDCGLAAAAPYEPGYEASGKSASAIDATAALSVCETAVTLDPDSLEDKTWLARTYLAVDRATDAVPLFETAIAGGWDPARVEYADALQYGMVVPAHPARAFALYADAATRQFAPAELGLGMSYQMGNGVPINLDLAEKWYRRAVAHGYAQAQYSLDSLTNMRAMPLSGPQRAAAKS